MAQYIVDAQGMNMELHMVIEKKQQYFNDTGLHSEPVICRHYTRRRLYRNRGPEKWSVELRVCDDQNMNRDERPLPQNRTIFSLPLENFNQRLADVFLTEYTRLTPYPILPGGNRLLYHST